MPKPSAYRTVFRPHFLTFKLKTPGTRIAYSATMGKYATHYTDEELNAITEQWLKDKSCIDREMEGLYLPDIDRAYIPYLHNKNLQALFRYAIYLYHFGVKTGEFIFYRDEQELVSKVYERIKSNGYYDISKEFEKKVRVRLGNAVKRQSYRKYKKS